MKATHSNRKSFTLMGLLLAFMLSAVVIPALGSVQEKSDSKIHLTPATDAHTSQGVPLPLPGEKEEEESRTDKQHTLVLTLFSVVFEKLAISPAEPTTWAFNHTNASALSGFPIYLAQHLLLI